MSNLNEMTIAQLTVELNKLTGKNLKKAKGSKEAIIAQIQELQPKPKARKRGPSTKDVLRSLFNKDGAEFTLEELAAKCNTVKLNTIETAIIDLKNPKWSVGPTMNLVKDVDGKIIRA